jgi:hypothetical protein
MRSFQLSAFHVFIKATRNNEADHTNGRPTTARQARSLRDAEGWGFIRGQGMTSATNSAVTPMR